MMLSRSAENLYWMSRYIERAENAARVLDVSKRMSLMPAAGTSESLHWRPAIETGPDPDAFFSEYDEANATSVVTYMALDRSNPSSIWSCIRAARENARAERTRMSNEMWEALNETWLRIADLDEAGLRDWGERQFFEWVKSRSHLFRGVTLGTALQDDPFRFVQLGTFLERADSTARILDVKYHVLLPGTEDVGGAVDYYQWGALLRSVSAFRAYRKIYHREIAPARVAEMLILNGDFPRSLRFCMAQVQDTLDHIAKSKQMECARLAGELHSSLRYGRIEKIFKSGLHEFLEDFIEQNNQLGSEVQRDFIMSEVVEQGG